jgi:hypothetical protein
MNVPADISDDTQSARQSRQPRVLSKEDAAIYCGCESPSTFYDWIKRGIIPGPIPGTHRWDRKAIDLALDKASGIGTKGSSALEAWRARRDARTAQRDSQG